VKKHTLTIHGHVTSISLEDEFWDALKQAANEEGLSVAGLVGRIDEDRNTGLSSAIRVFLFKRLADK